MLDGFERGYDVLNRMPASDLRERKLAQLMTEMERYYNIPMNKERFEREIAPEVRELYLAVSSARNL